MDSNVKDCGFCIECLASRRWIFLIPWKANYQLQQNSCLCPSTNEGKSLFWNLSLFMGINTVAAAILGKYKLDDGKLSRLSMVLPTQFWIWKQKSSSRKARFLARVLWGKLLPCFSTWTFLLKKIILLQSAKCFHVRIREETSAVTREKLILYNL